MPHDTLDKKSPFPTWSSAWLTAMPFQEALPPPLQNPERLDILPQMDHFPAKPSVDGPICEKRGSARRRRKDVQSMGSTRLTDQVYSEIVEHITTKGIKVGDRLPSEVKLAEMLSVSRTIVREALVRLAADGITESRRGAGSYVKNRPSDHLIAYAKTGNLSATLGTYEVRFVLEAEAARLAAIRRSVQDITDIENALKDLRAVLLAGDPAHIADMELHRRIVLATGNPAFLAAFESLSGDVNSTMRAGVDISRERPHEVIDTMMREHEAIVAAIRAQDGDSAALAMRWHLSQGRKRLMP